MKEWKIAFVGMGSIGRRHFRNVCSCLARRGDRYQIDLYSHNLSLALEESIVSRVSVQYELSESVRADKQYDAVFITNPTTMHFDTLQRFLPMAKAIFLEKPAFDRPDVDLTQLDGLDDTICYVACPLRYHPVLCYVKKNVDFRRAYAARAISSSYLPDWRPNVDYRTCYSAHRDMGGGVAIDLIHEWDYLTDLFGMPQKGYALQRKVSGLEIDSEDIASYIADTGKTVLELHLDYFGHTAIRRLDLFLPEETLECDIQNGTIRSGNRLLTFAVSRDVYQTDEIIHFFDIAEGRCENDNTLERALRVLRIAKGEFAE